jgi:hypothetical protein
MSSNGRAHLARHRDTPGGQASEAAAGFRSACWCNGALARDNALYAGTGGVSERNRSAGFAPAYRDLESGEVVLSRFADGTLAPVHVLEGLPAEWVLARDGDDCVTRVRATVEAGFVRDGQFYTREAAALSLSETGPESAA